MRAALTLLLLSACAPPASQPSADLPAVQSEPSAANTSADAALTWADIANAPQTPGQWRVNAGETRADFGADATTSAFSIGCDRGFLQLERTLARPHGVPLGTGAPFNVLLPRETIGNYVATPAVDRSPRLWLAVSRDDFRLDDLAASTDGFAIQTAGDVARFPHDPLLARVLANCRAR